MADLFRINGVASQYAELLERAGVDTVKELKHRSAENLAAKMTEVNDAKNLVRRPPSATVVSDWISQAKKLPGMGRDLELDPDTGNRIELVSITIAP